MGLYEKEEKNQKEGYPTEGHKAAVQTGSSACKACVEKNQKAQKNRTKKNPQARKAQSKKA